MQLAKELQKIVVQNIKIIIGVCIIIILSLIIFYVDIFDLDLFNKKYIKDLETELLELKQEIKQELKEELKQELTLEKNNDILYYVIGGCIIIIMGICIFYYYNSGNGDIVENVSSNILNRLDVEETEVKYTEDKVNRRLDFATTPTNSPIKNPNRYTSDLSPIYEKGIKVLKDI